MKRDNRIPDLRNKRVKTKKIIPNKKNISPRKKIKKSMATRVIGSFIRPINFLLKLIIRFILGWALKGTLVIALITTTAVIYYKINLPPLNDMLDARAKGSVILLDKNKKTFAWRGEQFGAIALSLIHI